MLINIKKLNVNYYIFILYFATTICMYPFYKYVFAQDELSYITIALKYYSGNYSDAINGIWSPLISWLLVPFIALNIYPPFAFKIVQIMIGFFSFYFITKLMDKLVIERNANLLFKLGLIPSILFFVYFTGTPDLLLSLFLIVYIYLLVKYSFNFTAINSIIIGIVGTLIYLSKAYGFPFYLIHFFLLNLIIFIFYKSKRIEIIKFYFLAVLLFATLSASWIFLLNNKYGVLNYTLASEYNYNLSGPSYNKKQTMRIEKLYYPTNKTAVSYWEDPSFLKIKTWSPFESVANFTHQLNLILVNTKIALYHLSVYLILSIFYLILNSLNFKLLTDKYILLLLISLIIYVFGLSLIMIEYRFLIFPIFIMNVLLAIMLSDIIKKFRNRKWKLILIVTVSLTIIIVKPTYSIISHFNYGKEIYELGIKIKKDSALKGNIASRSEYPLKEDWANTSYLAYVNNSKYFGEVNRKFEINELSNELKNYKIDYLFVWDYNIDLSKAGFKLKKFYLIKISPSLKDSYLGKRISDIAECFGMKSEKPVQIKKLWIYEFN